MKFKSAIASLSLILATAIWGMTFPLIKDAVREISPFSFMAVRFCLAAAVMWIVCALFEKTGRLRRRFTCAELVAGGILGLLLFLGCGLQVVGLQTTTASNAGFITGMSVVLVPLIQHFRGHTRIGWNAWTGVAFAVVGLALLSMPEHIQPNPGDFWVLLCAVAFAVHIVVIGTYSSRFDPLRMTWLQVAACGLLSIPAALIQDGANLGQLAGTLSKPSVLVAVSFCALFATAIAYFIQNHFQRYSTPTKTALIFTCEPIFSAAFSYLLIHETLNEVQLFGSVLLVVGMLVSELGEVLLGAFQKSRATP